MEKSRKKLVVPLVFDKVALEEYVRGSEAFERLTAGQNVVKIIPIPNKLVNIVVKP